MYSAGCPANSSNWVEVAAGFEYGRAELKEFKYHHIATYVVHYLLLSPTQTIQKYFHLFFFFPSPPLYSYTATTKMAVPSRERVETGSFNIPKGTLPPTSTTTPTPDQVDKIASDLIQKLNDSIKSSNWSSLKSLFLENSYWRDHLVLSWDFRTLSGPSKIAEYISSAGDLASSLSIDIDRSSPLRAPHAGPIDAIGEVHGIEFYVKIGSSVGSAEGIVRLAQDGSDWKLFTVFTSLVGIKGKEELIGLNRPAGVEHGAQSGRKNWLDRRDAARNYDRTEPDVLIVGML